MARIEPKEQRGSRHEQRSKDTRDQIYRATLACLDRYGYAETTFAKVQQTADLSRGAITHHFPNKESLLAYVALRLLDNILQYQHARTASGGAPLEVHELAEFGWDHLVNSPEGRAFVEIVVASRTDASLLSQLSDGLAEWDREISRVFTQHYVGRGKDDDDAAVLWAIARSFFRGLIIHQQFVQSPEAVRRMIRRFGDMLSAELQLRRRD